MIEQEWEQAITYVEVLISGELIEALPALEGGGEGAGGIERQRPVIYGDKSTYFYNTVCSLARG